MIKMIKLMLAFSLVVLSVLMLTLYIYYVGAGWSLLAGPILLSAVLMGLYWLALTFATYQASFKKFLLGVAIAVSLLLVLHVIDIPGAGNVLILAMVGAVFLPVQWLRHRQRRA